MKNLCQIHFTLLPVSVRTTNHPPANGQVERLSVTITKRSCRAVTARESTGNFPKPSPFTGEMTFHDCQLSPTRYLWEEKLKLFKFGASSIAIL